MFSNSKRPKGGHLFFGSEQAHGTESTLPFDRPGRVRWQAFARRLMEVRREYNKTFSTTQNKTQHKKNRNHNHNDIWEPSSQPGRAQAHHIWDHHHKTWEGRTDTALALLHTMGKGIALKGFFIAGSRFIPSGFRWVRIRRWPFPYPPPPTCALPLILPVPSCLFSFTVSYESVFTILPLSSHHWGVIPATQFGTSLSIKGLSTQVSRETWERHRKVDVACAIGR